MRCNLALTHAVEMMRRCRLNVHPVGDCRPQLAAADLVSTDLVSADLTSGSPSPIGADVLYGCPLMYDASCHYTEPIGTNRFIGTIILLLG